MTFWFNEIFPVGRYGSLRPSGTQPRRHVVTINLRRSCWNGCFFRPLHAPLVSASQSKKWSRDDKHLLRDYILQYSCCKFLRSCTFEAKPILAIDFASVALFSVTHFELYLSKKNSAKLNKLTNLKQPSLTVGKIRWFYSWEKSVHHYFFLNPWGETKGTCKRPEKTPFQQTSRINSKWTSRKAGGQWPTNQSVCLSVNRRV